MSTATPSLPAIPAVVGFVTLDELLTTLPTGFPASRIRLTPAPGTATYDDVVNVRRLEGILCEIYDGVLVEKPMGQRQSVIAMYIGHVIYSFLEQHELDGCVSGADSMLRLFGRQLRMPDVAFFWRSQFADGKYPEDKVWTTFPALAVEVLSDSNTEEEMTRKIGEYFDSGCRLVWIVDPATKTVTVYTSPEPSHVIDINGTVDGGEVLPGFQIAASRIFRNCP